MKTLVVLATVLLTTAVWGADPLIGTWKVNLDKSKYDPGPPPKVSTAVFSEDGDFIVLKVDTADAQGQSHSLSSRWKKDGKDYALTGSTTTDALAAKRVNDRITDFTYKKGGKVISNARVVVSRDGKAVTTSHKGTNAEGKPFHNQVTWEKQ